MRSTRSFSIVALVIALGATMLLPSTAASAQVGDAGGLQTRDSIYITSNKEFDPAHGVRSGSGTASDPYVISGWKLDRIYIKDTDRYVTIRGNEIEWDLTLDWIGDRVDVRDNTIGDLRVNQNVRRKGDMTSGIITNNKIGRVGQIRHWDGVFSNNVVGSREQMMEWPFPFQAVNADGFNGGVFKNNTVYGFWTSTLHGHHHSNSFSSSEASHYHGQDMDHAEDVDHTDRYHRVLITGNKIYSDYYYALNYNDVGHAANDRTAASETNKALNLPHVHRTRVLIHDNELVGSGLHIDVFNAKDERHLGTRTGLVDIRGNKISLDKGSLPFFGGHPWAGISVERATDARVNIVDNEVSGISPSEQSATDRMFGGATTGIDLGRIDLAKVYVLDNRLAHHEWGVKGYDLSETVYWWIGGLRTSDVTYPVYYDGNNVANKPKKKD